MIAVLFAGVSTYAQDLTSKKGEAYLPEAGEWAIGIDASPFLTYFGNMIGGDGSNAAPIFNSHADDNVVPGTTVFGKYFIDANTAYRGKFRIGMGSAKIKTTVQDLSNGADFGETVVDEAKTSSTNIVLGGGLEKRKGNSRLQGVYGADAFIGFGSSKTAYTYGNRDDDQLVAVGQTRPILDKQGGTTSFGFGAFIGAEYFFAPKMSIGGEYNWGLAFTKQAAGSVEQEEAIDDDGDIAIETVTNEGGVTSSGFGIDTGANGSFQLRLMLHF